MKRAVIIDDEPLAREIIKEYLREYPDIELVAECSDGFEGLKAIQQLNPDLVFLDIQMPKINGFEMLELIDTPPEIIFTTAFDEFAIRAFDKNAVDYLLKPFNKDRFRQAIEKSGQTASEVVRDLTEESSVLPGRQDRVVLKEGSKIKIIPVSRIRYMEAADDYVKIITEEGTFLKNKTMAYYEKSLSVFQFIRIHRSYLVNTQLITRIEPYEKDQPLVILSTGERLPVSKTGYARLRAALGI